MGRKKLVKDQEKYNLTLLEKKYIDLILKTSNNVNYDELFKRLSIELDKPEEFIRSYTDLLPSPVKDESLPPEPTPKVLKPEQKFIRDVMTPNRESESNKARHVTVMSDAVSQIIEKSTKEPIKGSSKFRENIFRQ